MPSQPPGIEGGSAPYTYRQEVRMPSPRLLNPPMPARRNLVTRKHCCKGCEGRVLRSIQVRHHLDVLPPISRRTASCHGANAARAGLRHALLCAAHLHLTHQGCVCFAALA